MKNNFLIVVLFFITINLFSQTNQEIALSKAKEAIKLMDDGKIDESIVLLEECQKLDSNNFTYPYEIAFAHTLKKDYESAIKILKKLKKYKNINSQVYQMLGNSYSYMGKSKEAIKSYEEGMKVFPNSGNLHLEKGNVYLAQKNYNEAIKSYEKGIEIDPNYPSNYYRLAKLFLSSTDKLSGLIYGELFMNLERTTDRTREMSDLLYQTYKSSIILGADETKIEFCEIYIDASELLKMKDELKLPLCAIFGQNFILATIDTKEFNLNSLSDIRSKFLKNYFKEDYIKHPNVLFNYQKELLDSNNFDAYNHYIFQFGAKEEFSQWLNENDFIYHKFVNWYTLDENILKISKENKFLR